MTKTDREQEQDELTFIVVEGGDGPARVIVHNDDVTPFDFVIEVLVGVFKLSAQRAWAVTTRAHYTGTAHVATLPLEEAKHRVGQAHQAARLAGYPLSFTIES